MRLLSIILSLCIYTQSFGYIALSVSSHQECQSISKHTVETHSAKHEKETTQCCSSKTKTECEIQETLVVDSCSSEKDLDKEDKGCCGDKDCDCHCCFHFTALQSLYFIAIKHENSLSLENYYKSKYNYQDAIQKDLLAMIFHPPQA